MPREGTAECFGTGCAPKLASASFASASARALCSLVARASASALACFHRSTSAALASTRASALCRERTTLSISDGSMAPGVAASTGLISEGRPRKLSCWRARARAPAPRCPGLASRTADFTGLARRRSERTCSRLALVDSAVPLAWGRVHLATGTRATCLLSPLVAMCRALRGDARGGCGVGPAPRSTGGRGFRRELPPAPPAPPPAPPAPPPAPPPSYSRRKLLRLTGRGKGAEYSSAACIVV